jgi:hypothetical protein
LNSSRNRIPRRTSDALHRCALAVAVLGLGAIHTSAMAQAPAPRAAAAPDKATSKGAAKSSPAKLDQAMALNLAVRQPMLAERITKAFLMINLKALVFRSRNQLDESLIAFEAALKDLQKVAPTAEIRENYQLLEQLFDEFKEIKSKPVTVANATALAEQNEELVWIAQKGATMLREYGASTKNELIATAGEARTVAQRLAKLYLFRAAGIRSAVIGNDLKKAETDYRAAVQRLIGATPNTPAINSELALAETQWIFLKQAIERLNSNQTSSTELEHVSKACDNISEVMERVTALYERI